MEVEEKIKGQMVTRHIIDREEFTHILMNFGEKMTQDEIDDIYGEFDFDDNKDIFTKSVVDLFVAGAMDEKKEGEEEKKEEEAESRQVNFALERGIPTCVFILVEFHYLFIYCCQTINKTDVMLKQ